jgi:hypothetical protein
MTCAREGCIAPARRKYCSETCRRTQEQRRARAKECAPRPAGPIIDRIAVTVEVKEYRAFGVPCDRDVAWIFADDARRFGAH